MLPSMNEENKFISFIAQRPLCNYTSGCILFFENMQKSNKFQQKSNKFQLIQLISSFKKLTLHSHLWETALPWRLSESRLVLRTIPMLHNYNSKSLPEYCYKDIFDIFKYFSIMKSYHLWTSSQDGGIGRYTLLPHTTKRRTTNLKTKITRTSKNQTVLKSTTKELKKKHSFQLVGGTEQASRVTGLTARQWLEDWVGKVAACSPGSPTFAHG